MPTPNQQFASAIANHGAMPITTVKEFEWSGFSSKRTDIQILTEQVEALTTEVQELKKMLEPIPSFILTGQQVLAEFERLQKRKP